MTFYDSDIHPLTTDALFSLCESRIFPNYFYFYPNNIIILLNCCLIDYLYLLFS